MSERADSAGMTKEAIRALMRAKRQALEAEWIAEASRAVQERVVSLPEFAGAATVFCYLAKRGEVQTRGILEMCWKMSKRVCVPAYDAEAENYAPALLNPRDALRPGRRQVLEPAAVEWLDGEPMELVIVPGLAFDGQGGRLGHGGGAYDRLLKREGVAAGFKLGIGFEFQMVDRMPIEANDVNMDAVVTEKATYRSQEIGCGVGTDNDRHREDA